MPSKTLLIGEPNEKQAEFFRADTRFIAYGGARGGGKSWAVRKKAILLSLYYGGIRILLLRRTLSELRENHLLPLMADLKEIAPFKERERAFLFGNGSRLRFGYCDSESDVLQYQGQEYDVIFMDEATHFTEFQYNTLTACLRGANPFPKRMYLTCNPGGIGHAWVKRLFIDREYRQGEHPEDYLFIPAKVYDNKILMESDPHYVEMLKNLPFELREAWLNGNWNVFAGQYFREYDPAVHVVQPFPIPPSWKRYRAIDYGLDMLSCGFYAVDPQGRHYRYREIHESNLIISDAAKRILEETDGERIEKTYAPPDLWNRRQDTGKSAAELFAASGVPLTKASNDRINGWLTVKEMLKPVVTLDEQTGKEQISARLRIFDNCTILKKHLPLAQHDAKMTNDVANEPHYITHVLDELRYYCVSRTVPPNPAEESTPPTTLEQAELEQFLNEEFFNIYG